MGSGYPGRHLDDQSVKATMNANALTSIAWTVSKWSGDSAWLRDAMAWA